jgi:hypothetical protein
MNRAAADDGAARCAGRQFSEGHPNRHDRFSLRSARPIPGWKHRSRLESNKRRERLKEQWLFPEFDSSDAEKTPVFERQTQAVPKRDYQAGHL